MSGRGEVGAGGGPAGDLYVEIVETAHETLMREGDNLHLALAVSMAAATLGTKVKVETLDGPIEVEVKAGTQSGATIMVKGKGMTHLRRGTRGDLIVHVEVKIPTKLNKAEEELMRKFAESRGEKAGEVEIKDHDQSFFHKLRGAFGR
jgi:molecular chaperone DnaJ